MASAASPSQASLGSLVDLVGEFPGGFYKIDHRNTNTLLSVTLASKEHFYAQPGSMVTMSHEVKLEGKFKFSFKKMFTGTEMAQSIYTGPGEILFAPPIW
jgi:uncharacterized protein (AIM24 family)